MKEAENGAIDTCIFCGKEIIYDKQDGFWDRLSVRNEKLFYSPECHNSMHEIHEPVNYECNESGIYFKK